MKKIKIELIILGYSGSFRIEKIKKFLTKSQIIELVSVKIDSESDLLNGYGFNVKNANKLELFPTADLSIVIVNEPLLHENFSGYFSIPVNEKLIVISVYDYFRTVENKLVSIEKFILRFIYGFSAIYSAYKRLPSIQETNKDGLFKRSDIGCLFDFSMKKENITRFFEHQPIISKNAEEILKQKNISDSELRIFKSEIQKLKISSLDKYLIETQNNPTLNFVIIFALGVITGLVSNAIMSFFK